MTSLNKRHSMRFYHLSLNLLIEMTSELSLLPISFCLVYCVVSLKMFKFHKIFYLYSYGFAHKCAFIHDFIVRFLGVCKTMTLILFSRIYYSTWQTFNLFSELLFLFLCSFVLLKQFSCVIWKWFVCALSRKFNFSVLK